ncbi:MAG: hypothetical protein CK424_06935 [Legionella sp.]|nr:MAG: hypothetical protein CK424_06935 [Legionella sp.]
MFFAQIINANALTFNELPESIYIRNELQKTSRINVTTTQQQIGLLELAPNKMSTFYYFDDQHQLQNTVILKKRTLTGSALEFDIVNQYQEKVASFKLYSTGLSRPFVLLSKDNHLLLKGIPGLSPRTIWITTAKKLIGNESLAKIEHDYMDFHSQVFILNKKALTASGVDVHVFNIMLSLSYLYTTPLQVD